MALLKSLRERLVDAGFVQFVPAASHDTTAETNILHVVAGKRGDGGGRDGSTGSEPQLAGVADWAAEKTGRVEDRETVI